MKKETGGQAFPDPGRAQSGKVREQLTDTGMTLRDYFAARAMVALVGAHDHEYDSNSELAVDAYVIADAMLKARQS